MRARSHRYRWQLLALLGSATFGCTLTHSLDDLKGGKLSSAGGVDSGASQAGSTDRDAGDAAGAGNGDAGGAAGDSATGGELMVLGPTDTVGWEAVSVQFNASMVETSITALTSGTLCGKTTIQLSNDDFTTCIPMLASPTWNADDSVVTFVPAKALTVGGSYELRVTTGASSQDGKSLGSPYEAQLTALYGHTIDIGDDMPFLDSEALDTSTLSQYKLYLAWDSDNLYLGMSGANIANNEPSTVFVAYFGGTPGAKSGMAIGPQTASLAFPAKYGIEWVGDDQQTSLSLLGNESGVAGAWDANALPSADKNRKGDLVKIKVPLSSIGSPTGTLSFASGLLYDDATSPSTYATTPTGAFSGMGYIQLDMTGHTLPGDSVAK